MQDAATRKFDVVLCWKLDRFGRSLIDCLAAIQQLRSAGVRFIAITQGIDTDENNPAARFQLQVLAAAAEFERELIREPVLAGTMRYRQDYDAGRIGQGRSSRSGKHSPDFIWELAKVPSRSSRFVVGKRIQMVLPEPGGPKRSRLCSECNYG